MRIAKMVDMAMTKESKDKYLGMPMPADQPANGPVYPYGLCISLTHDDLEKLDLDDNPEVGDLIHVVAMAKVTSVSKRDTQDGKCDCRIELQITHLGLEDETTEYEDIEDEELEY
jgi:hypothetical protein